MGNTSGSWTITLVLAAPTGWQFNSAVNPTLGFTTAKNITSITRGAFTSTSISITVTGTGRNRRDRFTIAGLQVQATSTSAATGNIVRSSLTGTLSGVTSSTNFGTLSRITPSAGTATVTIAAFPSTAICSGTSVTFTTSITNGGTLPTYQWRLNGSNISGATSTTYTTSTLANANTIACSIISNSCIATPAVTSANFTATVNATPNTSSFSTSAPSSSCIDAGAAITVNSTSLGAATFTVTYNLAGANNSLGNTATLTMGATTGTFTIPSSALDTVGSTSITITSISTSGGCSTTLSTGNTATTTVNALPTAVTVSGSGTYCGSGTLTASNSGSGTMYFQNTTSLGTSTSTPSSSQIISATGAYYFRSLSSGGCWSAEDTGNIIINSLPTAVTASGGGTYCGSTTITASNGGSGTIYYQGTTSGGTSVATPATSQVVTVSGTYYFRAVSTDGCWGVQGSVTVTINPLPNTISGTLKVCIGSTTTLSNTSSGGTWSSSSTSTATIGSSSGIVTGVAAGTSAITYILPTGCIATGIVSVAATPAAIGGASSVCSGSSTTFTNAALFGVWTSSNTSVATVGSTTGIVTGLANGTSVISYSTGCGTAATRVITVGNSPITGTFSACTGATSTLSNATAGGTWTSSNTSIAAVGSISGVVTGVAGGTANITYQSGACLSTATFTVNVTPAAIAGTASVCVGLTTTLTNATAFGTWVSAATGTATVGSLSGIVSGIAAGTATISYSTGCGSPATRIVTVNPLPSAIGGTLSVCVVSTTTLSSSGGGTWASSNTGIATIGSATGIVSGVTAGNATITYTLSTGCINTAAITVNPIPAAITGTAVVCVAATTTLSNATPSGTWASSNTSLATVGTSGVVTGLASGNPVITYSLSTGCIAIRTVTVNSLPAAIGGSANVCAGSTITLTNSGGGTWTSSNTSLATVGSGTGIVTGIASGTPTITYTLSTGCRATKVVTVNPLPSGITGVPIVCVGSTTTLSNAGGGSWTSSNTSIATVVASTGVVTGVVNGTATITYTLSTGCFTTRIVTVNPLPDAGTITGTFVLCESDNVTLSNSAPGGLWSSANDSVAVVDASGIVTGVAGGTVVISYSVTNSCGVDDATQIITVNPLPSADTIGGADNICPGISTTMTNAEPGGVWTSDNIAVATINASTGLLTGVSSGTTDITYTVTNGCGSDFGELTVTVNASPGAITGTRTLCIGATTSLASSGTGPWSSSNTGVATVGTSGVVSGVSGGTATITHTLTSSGCFVIAVVTVNPLATIGGSTRICMGTTTTLTTTISGGTWVSSTVGRATIGSSSGLVTPVSAGTTTISYTLPTGCRTTTVVTVANAPSVTSVANSGPICAGVTLTLSSSGPSNVAAYLWTGPVSITGATSASATIPSATTAATGVYSLTVDNGTGAGCSRTYTTSATVNSIPTAAPTNNGPKCGAGASVTLSANPAGGATVYAWSGPNLSSATVQNPTATPTVTATYSLTVTNGSGLSGCSPTTVYTTTVTVNSLPTAAPTNNGPICTGGTVTLTANPGGSTNTYLWSGPNLSSTTAQNPTATPTVTAVYSLTVSFGSGLPGCTSSVYTTTVTAIAGGNWLGTVSTDWFTSGNWCGGIPTTATAVLIPNGTTYYPLITTGTASANNLTIQSSASVTVTGGTLAISGAISNSGTFTASAGGTIEMNGSTAQTIPSSVFAGNTINNLTINNTGGVTLSDTLKIKGILTPAAGTFATGGYITLLSTSSQTALIAGSGSGSVTGNVTMQRYLPQGYGYKYISSPFTGATVSGLSSYIDLGATFPRLYGYNESLSTAGWVNYTADTNTLYPLKGYSANFGTSTAPVTFSLRGVVNNGTLSSTIYNNNNTYTLGFNLAGNPYPSPIDWTAASGWTKTNIDNAIYYFNSSDTNQYTGTYSSYIAGVSSDGVASNVIPAMQGFFVHVSSGSYPVTGTLGANNNVRVNNLSPYYHKVTAGADVPLVRLDALFPGNTANPDPTVIYLNDQASGNFNNETDALKLLNTSVAVPNLYSWSGDAKKLSIQALHLLPDSNIIVPLGLQTEVDGQVIFNARNIDNMPDGVHVYFYDIHAGKVQSLQTQPQYTTYLSKGKYENRFYLMLSNKDIKELPILRNELNAYSTGQSLFVYLLSDNADIVITNMLGQVLHREELTGTGYHEIKMKVSAGLYIATLYSGHGKQSKKVFIGKE
jgi:trimeric autotransporter adhesin